VPQVGDIPSYPGPLTLYTQRGLWRWILFGSAAFAIGAAGGIANHDLTGWAPWVGVVFFAACAAVSGAILLVPRLVRITLGPVDFEVVSLFTRWRSKWRDVSEFSVRVVATHGGRKIKRVSYNDNDLHMVRFGVKVNRHGHTCVIPGAYEGHTTDALAELMNEWRAKALEAHTEQSSRSGPAG
jgi:hypothetical protein